MTSRVSEGSPEPLGLTLDEHGANVAVFSAHANAIELCLFDANGQIETERLRLPSRTGDVFHGHIQGIKAGQRYGFRVYGPYAPSEGHRFNPAKLLVDPYALALDRPFLLETAGFGYRLGSADADLSLDKTDSAPFMPKAVAVSPALAMAGSVAKRPWAETVIYELHVRGFTKKHPRVPEAIRGTFAGLAHPAAIDHLVKLGVTAVEVMPCAAWADERHLRGAGLANYWGYNPIALMAPEPRLAPGGWEEIRNCTSALQSAGIEVIVDVVLNHSGEGDELGPTLSMRGFDNLTYYREQDNPRYLINDTGCGNTLALDRPPVLRLAIDALRAWVKFGGVHGFRFDLAPVLGRRDNGFDPAAPLITAISQDPLLRDMRLIAEPWDIGPGGYQIGAFPASWGEWNDQFRDTMRKFWRGEGGLVPGAVTRFAGSSDIFGQRHRRPSCSVNFIVAHDGFTLADLVSYERKHNEANGEANRDGTDANYSWNNGVEGATADPAILSARRRDQRNLLASLLLAKGTPMLAMGSESGQSQGGNNNAYPQNNATTWFDWDHADASLIAFTARLIALRKAHSAFTHDRFLTGEASDETLIPDVAWLTRSGAPMQHQDWSDPVLRTVIASLYVPQAGEKSAGRVLIVLHADGTPADVTLPETQEGQSWRRCVDTSQEDGGDDGVFDGGATVPVAARSVAVFEAKPADTSTFIVKKVKGVARDLLDRLSFAAGIAPDWYDIAGVCHTVPPETKAALLADMGLPAASSGEARDSLARLAGETDRRPLPSCLVTREGESIRLRVPLTDGKPPSMLQVHHDDGTETSIALGPADLELTAFTALDGRRVEAALVKLPPQPLGRHRIILEHRLDAVCHLTVAPRRCYLPSALHSGRKAAGIAAQLYTLRRAGDQGIGDLTDAGRSRRDGGARRLGHCGHQSPAQPVSVRPRARQPLLSLRPPVRRSDLYRR